MSMTSWPQCEELKPAEGKRIRVVIEHRYIGSWADNGTWEGTLVKAHADWWSCLLRLDDGTPKFLDLRNARHWETTGNDPVTSEEDR